MRRSHEHWFHFTTATRYYANVDPLRTPHVTGVNDTRKGRLPGSVWGINTEALRVPAHLNVKHPAAFPVEWPRRIITGWCPPGGVVLDPFGGSGTTALVAKALGAHGISLDMSTDYSRLAQWRVTDETHLAKARGAETPLDAATGPADAETTAAADGTRDDGQGTLFAHVGAAS